MAFDPDAYLAEKPKTSAFDPDAYLAAAPTAPAYTGPAAPKTAAEALAAAYQRQGETYSDPNFYKPVLAGVTDIPVAAAQLGARAIGRGPQMDEYVRQREAQIPNVPGATGARMLGGAVGSLPLMAIPGAPTAAGLLTRTGVGTAIGAGTSLLSQPVSGGDDFWKQKGEQAAWGGAIGGGLPLAGSLVGGVGQGLSWLRNKLSPEMQAQHIIRGSLENNPTEIANVMAANRAAPTQLASDAAAQTGVSLPGYQAVLSGVESQGGLGLPGRLRDAKVAKNTAELAGLAGGGTQTEALGAQELAHARLNQATAPGRGAALGGANEGKAVYSRPGSVDFDAVHPITRQGVNISSIVSDIRDIKAPPGIGASEVVQKTLSKLEGKIKALAADNGGFIHPEALYTIRKELGNDIQKFSEETENWDKRLTGGLQKSLQKSIDDAITKAGGEGWTKYLKDYELGMRGINQQELSAKALELYQKSPDQFVALVKGDAPDLVEGIFGPGNKDIKKVLGDKFSTFDRIAKEAQNRINAEKQAAAGSVSASTALSDAASTFRIPNMLSPKITVANKIIGELEGRVATKTLKQLRIAAESGQNMNALLDALPPSERSMVLTALRNAPAWMTSATPFLVNRLAPLSDNKLRGQ